MPTGSDYVARRPGLALTTTYQAIGPNGECGYSRSRPSGGRPGNRSMSRTYGTNQPPFGCLPDMQNGPVLAAAGPFTPSVTRRTLPSRPDRSRAATCGAFRP